MLESILAKLNPDESVWIKRELSKDPYRREEMVSLLLNVGNTGFGHKWDGQGPFESTCGKVFDYLEYKTSQAKKYNGLLKFHDYPKSKTLDWIEDNVMLMYATFSNGEIECVIGIAPIIDGVMQQWVMQLANQVAHGVPSPTIARTDWEDAAVCLEHFTGEFKNPKAYTKGMRELIMKLHENNTPTFTGNI